MFQHCSNVLRAADHHIRMISEGSCDTKDWINDAENSTLHLVSLFFKMCIDIAF